MDEPPAANEFLVTDRIRWVCGPELIHDDINRHLSTNHEGLEDRGATRCRLLRKGAVLREVRKDSTAHASDSLKPAIIDVFEAFAVLNLFSRTCVAVYGYRWQTRILDADRRIL